MAGLTITTNPAALSFLFTEALYAPAEALKTVPPAETQAPEQPVETEAPLMAEPVAKEREEVFHYLGENRRFILILVNYPDETYLPAEEKDYLEKILGAVRLNLEDVALLNYARYTDRKYAELKDFFAFGTLLLFGVSPHTLQVPGPVLPYHLGLVEEVRILATDGTEVFRPDNEKKKQLWTELKRTFA